MQVATMSPHNNNTWSSFGWHPLKSPLVFFAQIIILYLVIIVSIVNLSLKECDTSCDCNLWTTLLTSSIAYLLPNPSLKLAKSKPPHNIFDATDELDNRNILLRPTHINNQHGKEEE